MQVALCVASRRTSAGFRSGLLAALAWLSLAAMTPPAEAALVYTASGGTITGTLGATPFTNASWRITATGDAANVQAGTIGGMPGFYNYVSPTLFLDTGAGVITATLLDVIGAQWATFSVSFMGVGGTGFGLVPPSLTTAPGFGVNYAAPASDLVTQGVWSGSSSVNVRDYQTSEGVLTIGNYTDGPGEFSVAAAPIPATWSLLALGLAGLRLRRGR